MRGRPSKAKRSREMTSWTLAKTLREALNGIDGAPESLQNMGLSLRQFARSVVLHAQIVWTATDADTTDTDPLSELPAVIREMRFC